MKVLLVCESSHINESGGRVVRYLTKILNDLNVIIKILVLSEKREDYSIGDFYFKNNIEFLPVKKNVLNRISNIFFDTEVIKNYKNHLIEFNPDIIHFASFDDKKPASFINIAKKMGKKVVLQPWTMQFYCAQGFGYCNNKICSKCASGFFPNAIKYNCIGFKGLPSLFEKYILRKAALKADIYLSSNTTLDQILLNYGVTKSKIHRFVVPFDCKFVTGSNLDIQDYYIYYGQVNDHKGINVLIEAFKNLPKLKLKIYPLSKFDFDHQKYPNIEVINGIGWNNGLKEAVLQSKAAIFPSLWATSTEYSMCEALLLKKPIIVFNVGVHKDIFFHLENAMVVKAGDINSFIDSIKLIDKDVNLRIKIANNGYNTIINLNDETILQQKLQIIYNS